MLKRRGERITVIGLFIWLCAGYSAVAADDPVISVIRAKLYRQYPTITIREINKTPIDGMYEVIAGDSILYTDSTGHYAIVGDLMDLDRGHYNLTEAKRGRLRLDMVNVLDPKSFIRFTAEKPKYTVTVFTDVDCGYCRQFHQDVPQLNQLGVSIRYAAFPRAGKDSQTYTTMAAVWCASDPKTALTRAKQGQSIEMTACDHHPLDDHLRLVQNLGLQGTPTLLFEDGSLLPGYLPIQQLMQKLEEAEKRTERQQNP